MEFNEILVCLMVQTLSFITCASGWEPIAAPPSRRARELIATYRIRARTERGPSPTQIKSQFHK